MVLRVSLLSLVVVGVAAPALAQPEDAEALIDRGVEARRAGDDERALELFRQAHALSPSGRALAQMGFAEQALGLWAEAYEHLTAAQSRSDEAWVAARQDVIASALETVRGHVGQLDVRGGVEGAEVLVNGRVRGTLPLTEPLVVAAGTVRLQVRAPGHAEMSRTVTVVSGRPARETVRLVRIAAPQNEVASDITDDEAPLAAAENGIDGVMIGGVVTLALATVAVGLGGAAFGVRESNAATFNNDTQCFSEPGVARREQCPGAFSAVQTAEILGGVGLGLGGALGIAGIVLLGVSASGGGGEQAAVRCGGGPGELGVACAGAF